MGKYIESVHCTPFKKKISYKIFQLCMIFISKIKTVACHIAAKSCVSEVKLCFRNYQIPYLKANSISKKSFFFENYA